MNWLTIITTAVKAFLAGLKIGKKVKAGAELEQGSQEVGTAERNSARVAAELAEPPPHNTAPLAPVPVLPSGPIRS